MSRTIRLVPTTDRERRWLRLQRGSGRALNRAAVPWRRRQGVARRRAVRQRSAVKIASAAQMKAKASSRARSKGSP